MRGKAASGKTILFVCIACFLAGSLFSGQMWTRPSNHENALLPSTPDCDHKRVSIYNFLVFHYSKLCTIQEETNFIFFQQKLIEGRSGDVMEEVVKTHQAIK